jgi:GTP cyclohydrolase I
MDKQKIKNAVRDILTAIGEDPDREGLINTPDRVAGMYEEVFSGIGQDVSKHIKIFHESGHEEMVCVKDIPLYSMCEHHLLPFIGVAHVIYIPRDGHIIGLSKIARIVDTLAKKPQLQERLTGEIADTIDSALCARGVAVVISAEHLCMTMRGIKKPGSKTITSALRGILKSDARSRAEAMSLIK